MCHIKLGNLKFFYIILGTSVYIKWRETAISECIDDHEIRFIENSVHAYVWMQLPSMAAEEVKAFIGKQKVLI